MLVEQNEGPLRDRLVEHTTQQGAQRAVVDRPDTRHYGKTRIGDPGCMRRYIRGLWCGRRSLQVCGVWPSSSAPARALRTVNTKQHSQQCPTRCAQSMRPVAQADSWCDQMSYTRDQQGPGEPSDAFAACTHTLCAQSALTHMSGTRTRIYL